MEIWIYIKKQSAGNGFGTIHSVYRISRKGGAALGSSRLTLCREQQFGPPAAATMHPAHHADRQESPFQEKDKHGLKQGLANYSL